MCKKYGQLVNRLLLHCKVAKTLWNGMFQKIGLAWVMLMKIVVDLLVCWNRIHNSPQLIAVWKIAYLRLVWCIW